jgi:hypothetical protein
VQHADRAACDAGTTGGYAAAPLPGFGRLAGDDISLKAFDIGQR